MISQVRIAQPIALKWSTIITLSAVAVEFAVNGDLTTPLRPLITLWFLIICPGMAFVQLLQIRDPLYETVLAVALSLVMSLGVAATTLYAGFWSPELILLILVGLSLVGVLCQLIRWLSARVEANIHHA